MLGVLLILHTKCMLKKTSIEYVLKTVVNEYAIVTDEESGCC